MNEAICEDITNGNVWLIELDPYKPIRRIFTAVETDTIGQAILDSYLTNIWQASEDFHIDRDMVIRAKIGFEKILVDGENERKFVRFTEKGLMMMLDRTLPPPPPGYALLIYKEDQDWLRARGVNVPLTM